MLSDKQVKKWFKGETSKNYKKYYPVGVLEGKGFVRKQCSCGTFFWSVNEDQRSCGDPTCSGGFSFFGKSPARKEMDYIEIWKECKKTFSKLGYSIIKRYPVVARWREDTDFVQASIYDFQPYVVSGEVAPPANPLVVPQFSLRFNDVDNVGITGAHYTGFNMIGQHAFDSPEKWDQEKYFNDIHTWLSKGLGLLDKEITFHEDTWAGGGNFGPCIEFFSRGLELGNQVYTMFEQTPQGNKELNLKVLDMGMGHERNAWFTKGASTSYETTFPTVCKRLFEKTGININQGLIKKFLPYSSYLNIDEVEETDKVWEGIAKKMSVDLSELKDNVIPLSALFSVAEHSRSLLVTLNDGALPSNVGGGYNLRMILRRALGFIDQYEWNVKLDEICEWHAQYLKEMYPELVENLDNVQKILDVEEKKYSVTKEKTKSFMSNLLKKKISTEMLLEAYDSQGINPDILRKEAKKSGKEIEVPDNFYSLVAQRHEKIEQVHATKKSENIDLRGINETEALYFGDYLLLGSKAKVLRIIDNLVIVDKTVAYPTSGGQLHDLAKIDNIPTVDIFKKGSVIIHKLERAPTFKEGDEVEIIIDEGHRRQLASHHTATHIINAAARQVLGNHINQAGAKKTAEKAHLDITHYDNITESELNEIERISNDIVKKNIKIKKEFMKRDEAEKAYGMRLYQGGAVPGKNIRVVDIGGIDIEACGGTHLNSTGEAGKIKIIKSTKIQDGVIRISFTAGDAAKHREELVHDMVRDACKLLSCEEAELAARAGELFRKWKEAKKAVKKSKTLDKTNFELVSKEKTKGDAIMLAAQAVKTQKEHLLGTLKRFQKELDEMKKKSFE